MKLRKILAAAMAFAVVCGAPAAVGTYQPGFELTANAWDRTEVVDNGIKYFVYADYAEVARNEGIAGDVNIASAVNGVPVTSIGFRAFEECQELTSITIPDGVTIIDDRAFCECSELASITLPDSLTSIGDDVFVSCSKLTSITLPEGLTSIGCDAFDECSGLTSITIPDSVTSIGYGAFYRCSGLTSIIIPDGVTSIGDWTFYECSALTSVTLPESVTSISDKAFTDHSDVTIYGYGGSYAETYANEKDIPFAAIEKAPETTTTTTTSQPTTTTTTTTTTTATTTTATTTTTTTTTTTAQETTTTTTATPEQPAVSFGDPNNDGKVDSKDASFVLVEYAKLSTGGESSLTEAEKSAADVNKDGKVDSKDASAILAYYALVSTTSGEVPTMEEYMNPAEPPTGFDPSTYDWPDINHDNPDVNMTNYTIDGTLYLGCMVQKLNDKYIRGDYSLYTDKSEYTISDSSIYIRRLIVLNAFDDEALDYQFWYSCGEYSRYTPNFVRNNVLYEYLFSGRSGDYIRVDLNGQVSEFPRSEMQTLVRVMTGHFSDMANFGYSCNPI